MAEKNYDFKNLYLSTISSSIGRARNLLLTISLVAAWLLACQLTDLLRWENIRTPASYNIGDADTLLGGLKLGVPAKNLRPSDLVNLLRGKGFPDDTTGSRLDDTVFISYPKKASSVQKRDTAFVTYPIKEIFKQKIDTVVYPAEKSFEEKVDWCQHYYRFILDQCEDTSKIHLVQMLLDRVEISDTKLPRHFINRPVIDVPVVGISIDLDDINILGAVILMFAMIWFRFALIRVKENIEVVSKQLKPEERDFFNDWLPMQFLFIRRTGISTSPFVHVLFFVPYIAVLFSLLVSLHDIFWQVRAYSILTGSSCIPLTGKLPWYFEQTIGLLVLRWGILISIVLFLGREVKKAWEIMVGISEGWRSDRDKSSDDKPDKGQPEWWLAFAIITAIPVFIMFVWTIARLIGLKESLKIFGWTYGPSIIGSFLILLAILIATFLSWKIWGRFLKSREPKENSGSPPEPPP